MEDKKKIVLLTRPDHFGKTINIDMLKTFLEMAVDKDGDPIYDHTTAPNYRLFVHGETTDRNGKLEKLSKPLLISKHQHIVDKYLGKHPVIYIDFSNIEGDNFETAVAAVVERFGDMLRRHAYLPNRLNRLVQNELNDKVLLKVLTEKRIEWYEDLTTGLKSRNIGNLKDGIKFLAKILHDLFSVRIFVLIDGYDAPFINAISNPNFPKDDKQGFLLFYTHLLQSTLANNQDIVQGILTGVFPLLREQRDAGLSIITEYTFYTGELMEFYGFNEWELQTMFDHLEVPDDLRNKTLEYYSRYEVRNSTLQVYRPWSFAYSLATSSRQIWFEETLIENFAHVFLQARLFPNVFHRLCGHFSDNCTLQKAKALKRFTADDLDVMYTATRMRSYRLVFDKALLRKISLHLVEKGFMFLYTLGYLSLDQKNVSSTEIGLKLPNPEVTNNMRIILKEFHQKLKYL